MGEQMHHEQRKCRSDIVDPRDIRGETNGRGEGGAETIRSLVSTSFGKFTSDTRTARATEGTPSVGTLPRIFPPAMSLFANPWERPPPRETIISRPRRSDHTCHFPRVRRNGWAFRGWGSAAAGSSGGGGWSRQRSGRAGPAMDDDHRYRGEVIESRSRGRLGNGRRQCRGAAPRRT